MKSLNLAIVFVMLCMNSFGQSWFVADSNYVFTAISAADSSQSVTLSVRYQANGDATITRSFSSVDPADKELSYYFGPDNGWSVQGDSLYLDQQYGYKYWVVSFNTYEKKIAGDIVTIICDCKKGSADADCNVVWHVTNNGYILTMGCVPGGGCNICKKPRVSKGGAYDYQEPTLILNANTVSLR